jgi:CelD/BcsL family acetyltransferase involved in cellulose biosynthesis
MPRLWSRLGSSLRPSSRSAGVVKIEHIPAERRADAAQRWQELEERIGDTGVTSSWRWVGTWLEYFGDVPHYFVFGVCGDHTVGAALVTTPRYRETWLPTPSVFLGTAGEHRNEAVCQYNRMLVAREDLDGFASGLMRALAAARGWQQIVLQRFVPEQARALAGAGREAGVNLRLEERRSPAFNFEDLPADADVLSALTMKAKHIRGLRSKIRTLDDPPGSLVIEWAQTPGQAKNILRELIGLHSGRMTGLGYCGSFSTERTRRYHEHLVDALWPTGSIVAYRIRRDAQTLSCLLGLVEDGRIIGFRSGTSYSAALRSLSPGVVAHLLAMEESRNRGYIEYDFGDPYYPYKGELSNASNELVWAYAHRGLWGGAAHFERELRAGRRWPAVRWVAIRFKEKAARYRKRRIARRGS